jgi:hypothetical protein
MRIVPFILLVFVAVGAAAARGIGLRFSRDDPAYPGSTAFRYPFELFSRGIEQTCENFMAGTIGGVDVVAFVPVPPAARLRR